MATGEAFELSDSRRESFDVLGGIFDESGHSDVISQANNQMDDRENLLEVGKRAVQTNTKNARNRYEKEARKLIGKIQDVNCWDHQSHERPLHHAAILGRSNIVKDLLAKRATVSVWDAENRTPLQICASRGDVQSMKLMLSQQLALEQRPTLEDLNRSLQCALDKKSGTCVEELLKAGAQLAAQDDNNKSIRPLKAILQLSRGPQILKNVLDTAVKRKNVNRSEHFFRITFDYSILVSDRRQTDLLQDLLDTESPVENLILHPLVQSYVYLKWMKIRWVFYVYFGLYLLFNIGLTGFVFTSLMPEVGEEPKVQVAVFQWFLYPILFVFLIKEVVQVAIRRLGYLRRFEKWLDVVSLILCCPVLFAPRAQWLLHVSVFALLLRWIRLTIMCGTFRQVSGSYPLMFYAVAKHLVKLLLSFIFLFAGFASAFYIVFHKSEAFQDWGIVVWTISMMVNALDFDEYFYGPDRAVTVPGTAHVVYGAFVLFICLVLLNLFIALAVNDTRNIENQGRVYQLRRVATVAIVFEEILLFGVDFLDRKFPRLGSSTPVRRLRDWMTVGSKISVDGDRKVRQIATAAPDNRGTEDSRRLLEPNQQIVEMDDSQEHRKNEIRLPVDIFRQALRIKVDRGPDARLDSGDSGETVEALAEKLNQLLDQVNLTQRLVGELHQKLLTTSNRD